MRREWPGAEFDLGLGLGTELILHEEIVAISAWLQLTARQELRLDRIAVTGIPGEHGPLQLLSPRKNRYEFPWGDVFPEDVVFNQYLWRKQRLSPGETLQGFLLAYVQGGLPGEEHPPQPLRLALHVLAEEGRNRRRQRQVLLLEHAFPVLDYGKKPRAGAEQAGAPARTVSAVAPPSSAADKTGLAEWIPSILMER